MENKRPVVFLVRTAAMIAITAVFQVLLRMLIGDAPWTRYIISTLVNLSMTVSVAVVGLSGGLIVALVAPVVAFLFGATTLPLMPAIMVGNAVFVAGMWLALRAEHRLMQIGVIIAASVLKFAVITLGMFWFVAAAKGLAFAAGQQVVQLVTGIVGGVLGVVVARMVRRALREA